MVVDGHWKGRNVVLGSHWKGLFLEMESFSNLTLERDELRDFEVFPVPPCGSQPEMLNSTENLAMAPPLLFPKGTRHHGERVVCLSRRSLLLLRPH